MRERLAVDADVLAEAEVAVEVWRLISSLRKRGVEYISGLYIVVKIRQRHIECRLVHTGSLEQ